MRPILTGIPILGAAVGLLCACAAGPAADEDLLPLASDSVFVMIVNETQYDARVHAFYRGGARYPLGTVGSNRTTEGLAIPWQPRGLSVEIDLVIGPGVFRSQEVTVAQGDLVEVRIPPNIQTSGFFIRVQ